VASKIKLKLMTI